MFKTNIQANSQCLLSKGVLCEEGFHEKGNFLNSFKPLNTGPHSLNLYLNPTLPFLHREGLTF